MCVCVCVCFQSVVESRRLCMLLLYDYTCVRICFEYVVVVLGVVVKVCGLAVPVVVLEEGEDWSGVPHMVRPSATVWSM